MSGKGTRKKTRQRQRQTLSPIKEELHTIKEETSAQVRSEKSKSKSKSPSTKFRKSGKKILKFMSKHRNKIRLRFLNTICSDSNVCIAFGKEIKVIREFFKDFSFELFSEPPVVVGSSTNGTVQLLTFERDGYVTNAIFKTSNKVSSDNLAYEAIVGQFINRQKLRFPCFLETYGLFHNDNSRRRATKEIKDYKKIEINKESIIGSCENSLAVGIMIENIKESKTLKKTLMNLTSQYVNFMNFELIYILYQIYAPLSMLSDVFTHYDLHTDNVMLYEPVKGKHIEYHYHYGARTVTFNSGYLVKIIDYGRCFFEDEQTRYNPRDIYKDLCEAEASGKACYDCGDSDGFTWLDPTPSYHISSQTRNMSHDLRLIHVLKDLSPTYNDNIVQLIRNTFYSEQYGTPEITEQNDVRICNVNDAKRHLEKLMRMNYYQMNNDYDPALKLGEMHIYNDGRPMVYKAL